MEAAQSARSTRGCGFGKDESSRLQVTGADIRMLGAMAVVTATPGNISMEWASNDCELDA